MSVMKKKLGILLVLTLVFSIGFATPESVSAKTIKPKKMTLNATSKKLDINGSFTIKVKKVYPKKASKAVSYKSSNTGVVKVNSKGLIVARKQGTAKITVTSKKNKKLKKTVKVTVGSDYLLSKYSEKNDVKNKTFNKLIRIKGKGGAQSFLNCTFNNGIGCSAIGYNDAVVLGLENCRIAEGYYFNFTNTTKATKEELYLSPMLALEKSKIDTKCNSGSCMIMEDNPETAKISLNGVTYTKDDVTKFFNMNTFKLADYNEQSHNMLVVLRYYDKNSKEFVTTVAYSKL